MNGTSTIAVPVTYQREWQDGFGARGWKLDVSINEPSVIAATAETGERIPTSVLVHDILDHHLCGFRIGGHRNEAMALLQLAARTGADPRVDFRQIIDEDIMHGHCNGESLRAFLPPDLAEQLPADLDDDRSLIQHLRSVIDETVLRERLVQHFVQIGESVQSQVEAHWRDLGLSYRRRSEMGKALQQLLARVDKQARDQHWEQAHGRFMVGDQECALVLETPVRQHVTAAVGRSG
ncbi:MAG: hypothetical protein RQ736_11580 [Thiogranum sp.]|nr:hypothetical protein [Thiogranum sp.]